MSGQNPTVGRQNPPRARQGVAYEPHVYAVPQNLKKKNEKEKLIYIPTGSFSSCLDAVKTSDASNVKAQSSDVVMTIDGLTDMPSTMLQDDLNDVMASCGYQDFKPSKHECSFDFDFTPLRDTYSWRQAWQDRNSFEFNRACIISYKCQFFLWYTLNELTRSRDEVIGRDVKLNPGKYENIDFADMFNFDQGRYSLAVFLLRAMYPDDPDDPNDYPGRPIVNRLKHFYRGGNKINYINKVLANAVIEGLSVPELGCLAYNAFYEALERSTVAELIIHGTCLAPVSPRYLLDFYHPELKRMFSLEANEYIPFWRLSYPLLVMRKALLVDYLQTNVPVYDSAWQAFNARAAILALAFHPNARYAFACFKAANKQRYPFLSEMEAHHV